MKDLGDALREIWEDQRAFNLLFRPTPHTPQEIADQARDFVVFTESELHELLRTLPWKKHRRMPFKGNTAHMHEEGIDTFKCVLSLLQIIGVETPEKLIELYWQKTKVVQQRYREEWSEKLDRPCVVIDIDNVICDYITGMGQWMLEQPAVDDRTKEAIDRLMKARYPLTTISTGIPVDQWENYKHNFRVHGGKRTLPVLPDGRRLLSRCKEAGYRIVLLTSRPIDQYPNVLTDTLIWLEDSRLPFDFLWWGDNKMDRLLAEPGLLHKIVFAVDDDPRFIEQFRKAGVQCYWLRPDLEGTEIEEEEPGVRVISSLDKIEISDRPYITGV